MRRRRSALVVLATAAALADAWYLGGTRPFTTRSELLTAVSLAAYALASGRALVAGRLHPAVTGSGGGGRRQVVSGPGKGSLTLWVVALGTLAAWELVTYLAGLGGRRATFPSLSSLYDELARWHLAKAAVCVAWLALGAALAS